MIYSEIFHAFFIIAVYGIDLAKGEPGLCSFEVGRNIELGKMPLAYTFDKCRKPFIIYPDKDGYFTIDRNKKIVISCSNSTFELDELSAFEDIEVTCYSGTQFRHKKTIYDFSQFVCKDLLRSKSRKSNKKCQPNNSTVIDVGYKTKVYFFPLYCVCFDEANSNTLYTWYRVRLPFAGHYQDYGRTDFFQDSIHRNLDISSAYASHRKTINKILNLNPYSSKYFDYTDHYLTRGHLIPKADLYYAREQADTFNYLNISPQWQKFNVTWLGIEKVVRMEMKKNQNLKRVIVTGVYGTFTLPDARNRQQQLYLGVDRPQLAVPKFIWKMVYDVDNPRNSIVYISYNNRTSNAQKNVKRDIRCRTKLCPGKITNTFTLEWMGEGIIYCCDIMSFQTKYVKFDKDLFTVEPNATPAA